MKLKRKLYTRGEKQAFLELYKATRGFKQLPKGSSSRDVIRFNKLATDIKKLSMGDVKGFDRENAKILLNNIGMPKSASQVDRLINKYSNKRALVRLSKMKNTKGNNIDRDSILPQYNKSTKLMKKGLDINDLSNRLIEVKHVVRKPDNKTIKKLTKYARDHDIDVIRKSNDPYFNSKYDSYVETMPDMSKSIVGTGGKKYIGKVTLNTDALEEDLAHEIGHVKTYKSKIGKEIKKVRGGGERPQLINRNSRGKAYLYDKNLAFRYIADDLVTVANENSATAYGNSILRKIRPGKKLNEESQKAALSSYLGSAVNNAGHHYRESLMWI